MKKTYIIEHISTGQIWEYFNRLHIAKSYLETLPPTYRIIAMRGPRFGEGFHMYQVTYSKRVFLKRPI